MTGISIIGDIEVDYDTEGYLESVYFAGEYDSYGNISIINNTNSHTGDLTIRVVASSLIWYGQDGLYGYVWAIMIYMIYQLIVCMQILELTLISTLITQRVITMCTYY